MKKKDQTSEGEYQGRLNSSLKGAFNTQLQPLRSLETATKKRRALKKSVTNANSGLRKSATTASG